MVCVFPCKEAIKHSALVLQNLRRITINAIQFLEVFDTCATRIPAKNCAFVFFTAGERSKVNGAFVILSNITQ